MPPTKELTPPFAIPLDFWKTWQQSTLGATLNNPGSLGASWFTPPLDEAELDKRIRELKTVQFWLEQNTRMLQSTIEALQVQKMTLQTLKSMNVNFNDALKAFKMPACATKIDDIAEKAPPANDTDTPTQASNDANSTPPFAAQSASLWWNMLTQQFEQIAKSTAQMAADSPSASQNPAQPATKPNQARKKSSPKTKQPKPTDT